MPPNRDQPNPNRQRRRQDPMPGAWIWMIALVALLAFVYIAINPHAYSPIDYSQFEKLLKEDKIGKVLSKEGTNTLLVELKENAVVPEEIKKNFKSNKTEVVYPEMFKTELTTLLLKRDIVIKAERDASSGLGSFSSIFIFFILPTLIFVAIFIFFILPRYRDPFGGGFNYIKSPARRYDKTKTRVTFDDVADMTSAKFELQEIVDFLKNPEKFQRLGAQIPKGVLMIGPPGTGKTLLARAVAGEAGVPFFSISGSEFIQLFVGVGASRVRDMFRTAKESAPCLLFIDEIDAVGRMRGAGVGGGSDEREQTLNQILSEMDGFQPNESVIVIAATNRPDVLDSALLRPGRFDRHVTLDKPNWKGRMEILKVHTRNKPLADDVNLEMIARKMIGMSGADLRNLANEAALLATRENKNRLERTDFDRAADRVLMGAKREELLTEDDKRRTAYHEVGHTLVSWYEPIGDPPQKVTIIPRGQTGGVTYIAFDEDRKHLGLDYWKSRLAMCMGGRAAERLVYGQTYAGVESDLKQATRLARHMVTHWGMSERLGPMSFRIGEEHVFLGKEIQEARDFSEETARIIDEEVQKLLVEADMRAFEIIVDRRTDMDRLVDALLIKEELYREDLEAILGPSHSRYADSSQLGNNTPTQDSNGKSTPNTSP